MIRYINIHNKINLQTNFLCIYAEIVFLPVWVKHMITTIIHYKFESNNIRMGISLKLEILSLGVRHYSNWNSTIPKGLTDDVINQW